MPSTRHPLGFYLDPDTVEAAEVTAETFQVPRDGLKHPSGRPHACPAGVRFTEVRIIPDMARRSVTFTQFRNQATTYLDAVEKGDTLEIFRHGKPVAIVSPAAAAVPRRWREARPVKLRGVSLTQAVLAERRQAK